MLSIIIDKKFTKMGEKMQKTDQIKKTLVAINKTKLKKTSEKLSIKQEKLREKG